MHQRIQCLCHGLHRFLIATALPCSAPSLPGVPQSLVPNHTCYSIPPTGLQLESFLGWTEGCRIPEHHRSDTELKSHHWVCQAQIQAWSHTDPSNSAWALIWHFIAGTSSVELSKTEMLFWETLLFAVKSFDVESKEDSASREVIPTCSSTYSRPALHSPHLCIAFMNHHNLRLLLMQVWPWSDLESAFRVLLNLESLVIV